MKFLANMSLGKRVMMLTALGLLIGAGVLSYPGMKAANEATEMMLEDRLTTAHLVAANVDEFLKLSLNILQDNAAKLTVNAQPAALESQIETVWVLG